MFEINRLLNSVYLEREKIHSLFPCAKQKHKLPEPASVSSKINKKPQDIERVENIFKEILKITERLENQNNLLNEALLRIERRYKNTSAPSFSSYSQFKLYREYEND